MLTSEIIVKGLDLRYKSAQLRKWLGFKGFPIADVVLLFLGFSLVVPSGRVLILQGFAIGFPIKDFAGFLFFSHYYV